MLEKPVTKLIYRHKTGFDLIKQRIAAGVRYPVCRVRYALECISVRGGYSERRIINTVARFRFIRSDERSYRIAIKTDDAEDTDFFELFFIGLTGFEIFN